MVSVLSKYKEREHKLVNRIEELERETADKK
jgi:hypothetical protein